MKSILAFAALLGSLFLHAETIPYPAVPGLRSSEVYRVSVSGKPLWVEAVGSGGMEDLHVARWAAEGLQEVSISVDGAVTSWTVQPKSAGIRAHAEGNVLRFTFDGPGKYYVQVGDLPFMALLADAPAAKAPSPKDKTVDFFAPGLHRVGEISLHDNQTIYLAPGAHLVADFVGSARNVHIYGPGSVDGRIRVERCEDLCVEDIFIRDTRHWVNRVIGSEHTVFRNVKVFSHTAVWGLDGIDPVSCRDFLIEDCFIRTRDDCISIKSKVLEGYDDPSSRDITVRGCLLVGWDHADGVTLGFELNGGAVENILVQDCDILRARGSGRTGGHSAFSIVCDGASDVRNICFENIRVESDIEYKNLEIILTEAQRYGNGEMGSIKGVLLKDISWENPNRPFLIIGHPKGGSVEDVTFVNCYVAGKLLTGPQDADFKMEFTRGVRFVPGGEVRYERYPEQWSHSVDN